MVFAARFSALALFIIIGGVIADRIDRVTGMIGLDVFRGVAVAVMAVVGTDASLVLLAALTFVVGAGEAIFTPLYESVLPDLVPERMLQQANSLSSLIKNLGVVIGPAVAGLLVAGVGPGPALWLDASSFAFSAVVLLGLRQRGTAQRSSSSRESMFRSAWAGIRVVVRIRWLAALEWMAIAHTLVAVGPWFVLLPTIAVDRYGSVRLYGFFLAAFGVGGVLGALAGGRIRSRSRGLIALAGIGSFGFCCLILAWSVPPVMVAAVFGLGGFGTQMFDVVKTTAIQQNVDRQFLGRVFSLDFFAAFVTMPVGQVLGGVLVTHFGAPAIMRVAGVFVLVTTLLPVLAPGIRSFGARSGGSGDPVPAEVTSQSVATESTRAP